MEIQHAGLGAAYLRAHPDVPAVHDLNEPCAYCAGNAFDLDAIRERDSATATDPLYGARAVTDRRALLAEVDRLRGDNAVLSDAMVDRNIDRWDRGVAAERARIRAAVEGLVPVMVRKDGLVPDAKWDDMVTRAAVLAAIEGAEHD